MRTMTPTLIYMVFSSLSGSGMGVPKDVHMRNGQGSGRVRAGMKRPKAGLRRMCIALLSGTMSVGAFATPVVAAPAPPTVWLCRPGLPGDPCAPGFSITRYNAHGRVTAVKYVPKKATKIDCFYVYPTTSDQPGPQANFDVDPELRSIALYQAARYASECRVFAPVYRQITISGLFSGAATAAMRETAYQDVRNAWLDYLAHDNAGRGVVFIGHSQGAGVLRRLLSEEVDPSPAARSLLVSAILLGGNVTVKEGQDVGGDFQHIRACRSRNQIGCVIAFSTFGEPVPASSHFGRTSDPGLEVLCTNPASLRGGSGKVTSSQPTEPFAPGSIIGAVLSAVGTPPITATTDWVEYHNAYRAKCSSAGGANVLQVTPLGSFPALHPVPDPTWGLHLVDANIALGNLVKLVHGQARRWVHVSAA
jgi:hypothetical protein